MRSPSGTSRCPRPATRSWVQQTERVRDPERYGMSNVTFAVTYFGEERGPVTVAINENRSGDGGHAQALRAAEALVFPSASAS